MNDFLYHTNQFIESGTSFTHTLDIIRQFQQISYRNYEKLLKSTKDQRLLMTFKSYQNQIERFLTKKIQNSNQINSDPILQNSDNQSNQIDINHQPSYIFLRNVWQGKYCSKRQGIESSQDQIDRINKVVAMMKTRINYMTQKESYLYEKQLQQDRSNYEDKILVIDNVNNFTEDDKNIFTNQFIYGNPAFTRIKQELQKLRMLNSELQFKQINQQNKITKLQLQKKQLQNCLQNLKKKYQQTEKRLIEISKRNINLEQQLFSLKSVNQKLKLTDFKQNQNPFPTLLPKQHDSNKKIYNKENQHQQYNLVKNQYGIENIFFEVKLQKKNLTQKQINLNYSQNEEVESCKENHNVSNHQISVAKDGQSTPMRFKYIKHEGSGRKSLLSSVKSVDIVDNVSINKPKFQRTKPSFGYLTKKQPTQNAQDEKLFQRLKKKAIGPIERNFKSPSKELIIKSEIH